MKRRTLLAILALLIGALALTAVGCGSDDDDDGGEAAQTDGGEDGGRTLAPSRRFRPRRAAHSSTKATAIRT